MSRFDFGSLESESSGLADMYRVLGDAQSNVHASSYTVPAGLQTHEYAEAVLGTINAPDLARTRANTRARREGILTEAGVPSTYYVGAAALSHLHWGDRDLMLRQLAHVQTAIEEDIEVGPTSLRRIGIVPVSFVRPLPEGLPAGMGLSMPRDIRMVETDDGVFVMGNDQFEVDRIGDPGVRGREALRRQAMLGDWAAAAVFGEAALAQVADSRSALFVA